MITTSPFVSAIFAIALLPISGAALFQQSTAPIDADAEVIADFAKRVQQYHDLRDKVDEGAARQTQTKEPSVWETPFQQA